MHCGLGAAPILIFFHISPFHAISPIKTSARHCPRRDAATFRQRFVFAKDASSVRSTVAQPVNSTTFHSCGSRVETTTHTLKSHREPVERRLLCDLSHVLPKG